MYHWGGDGFTPHGPLCYKEDSMTGVQNMLSLNLYIEFYDISCFNAKTNPTQLMQFTTNQGVSVRWINKGLF